MTEFMQSETQLKRAITWLGVVPAIIISISLLVVNHLMQTKQQQDFHHRQLLQTKMLVARYWAQNFSALQSPASTRFYNDLADILLTSRSIQSLLILDLNNKPIAHYGLPLEPDQILPKDEHSPVELHNKTLYQIDTDSTHLIVALDKEPLIIMYYQLTAISLAVLLVTAVALLWLAISLYSALSRPLKSFTQHLKNTRAGRASNERETLQLSIYAEQIELLDDIVSQYQHELESLKQSIAQSTEELSESLETVEIQNIELDLARKSALQANRIKSEFLANTSEEIRRPLQGIIDFTQLLLRTDLTAQQSDYVTSLGNSADGVLTLISDIVDFSRLETGKLQLEYKAVHIRQLLSDVVSLYAPSSNEKNVRLLSTVDHELPEHLLGDPQRIKQVLANLISNAIKFTEQGNVLIEVVSVYQTEGKIQIKISVTDSGIGLSEDQQQDIFDAFGNANTTNNTHSTGNGLGLPIAKGLVDKMDGTIGLRSQLNQGSTFWFTAILGLPLAQPQSSRTKSLAGAKIFFLDEQTVSRNEICHLLKEWQLEVVAFNNLESLFESLNNTSETPPQLVIVDTLDVNNRFKQRQILQLTERLNKHYHLSVILLATASAARKLSLEIIQLNAVVVTRPIQPINFYQTLSNHIASIPSTKVSSNPVAPPEFVVTPSPKQEHRPHKLKLLVVDDNPSNTRLVFEFLKNSQVLTLIANSGQEALALFSAEKFDLILMDIQMPIMDGFETTKRLRQLESGTKRTPIVALTAHAVNEHKSKLILAGMDDYLSKPVSFEELTGVIRKWLGSKVIHAELDSITDDTKNYKIPDFDEFHNTTTTLFNRAESVLLAKNNAELACDMLRMLIDSLEETIVQIEACLPEKNWASLQELSHKLYGACCYCGVPALKNASFQLDRYLHSGETSEAEELTVELLKQMQRLLGWSEEIDIQALFIEL